jgi:hypothetical protein
VWDSVGIKAQFLHLAARRRIISSINSVLEQELCESPRRVPFANLRS